MSTIKDIGSLIGSQGGLGGSLDAASERLKKAQADLQASPSDMSKMLAMQRSISEYTNAVGIVSGAQNSFLKAIEGIVQRI